MHDLADVASTDGCDGPDDLGVVAAVLEQEAMTGG